MVQAKRSGILSLVLSGLLLQAVGLAAASGARREFYERHKGPMIAAGVSCTFALILFLINRVSIARQRALHERIFAGVRLQYSETASAIISLQLRIDALPINDFAVQADAKIAHLRHVLGDDFASYARSLRGEIEALRKESATLSRVLAERQAYLEGVSTLLEGVRSNNNTAFLAKLVNTRGEVEEALAKLNDQKAVLGAQLNDLKVKASELESDAVRQRSTLSQFENEIAVMRRQAVAHSARADAAGAAAQRALDKISQAKERVVSSEQEFEALNGQLRQTVSKVEALTRESRGQWEAIEGQVVQARTLLNDMNSRVARLDALANQEEQNVRRLADRVERAQREVHSGSDGRASAGGPPSAGGSGNVDDAINALRSILQPFASGQLNSVGEFHSAYKKFSLKNHPDKGGNADLSAAVSGLLKTLEDYGLFESPSKYLSASAQDLLRQDTQRCVRYRSSLKR